jgi:hypothetical protein
MRQIATGPFQICVTSPTRRFASASKCRRVVPNEHQITAAPFQFRVEMPELRINWRVGISTPHGLNSASNYRRVVSIARQNAPAPFEFDVEPPPRDSQSASNQMPSARLTFTRRTRRCSATR